MPLAEDESELAGRGYLPPELARDQAAELRPVTDIYGLGLILYELLTGRPAFGGVSARETLDQGRSRDPIPPSRFNADVKPHLEAVCLPCLRKNPWRRFPPLSHLLTRMRRFQDNHT